MAIWLSHRPGFFIFFSSQVLIKKNEKPALWDRDMVTGVRSLKPDFKKWSGLWDSDMVIGGLKPWARRFLMRIPVLLYSNT